MNEFQEEVLILYQEMQSLPSESIKYILGKEMEMVAMFETILQKNA
ncbi:hypothetical protein GCM10020331_022740 [Ectobacillus funiculus]